MLDLIPRRELRELGQLAGCQAEGGAVGVRSQAVKAMTTSIVATETQVRLRQVAVAVQGPHNDGSVGEKNRVRRHRLR